MERFDYTGQIIGSRQIVRNFCESSDWVSVGKKVPPNIGSYRLAKCLSCGIMFPCLVSREIKHPSRGCAFCTGINNRSSLNMRQNIYSFSGESIMVDVMFNGGICSFFIDAEDYDLVKPRQWRVSKKRNKLYIATGAKSKGTLTYLHQLLLKEEIIPAGYEIDHIDGNSLNNRRSNLRVITRAENARSVSVRIDNKIGIRGVSKCGKNKYVVDFCYCNHRYYFKHWSTIQGAVYCRKFAEEHFGLEILCKNPNSNQYLILSQNEQDFIKLHVEQQISGN